MSERIDSARLEALGAGLADLAAASQPTPRAGFASSLRDRLLAEARTLETNAAEAFQHALDGMTADPATAQLAGFAAALAPAVPITAPPALRQGLRDAITGTSNTVASLAAKRAAGSFASRLRSSARATVAAAVAASMISTSAVAVAASASALPGDTLWSVKRFRERVQTWTISGIPEGMRSLDFAETRIDELEDLAALDARPASDFTGGAIALRETTEHGASLILASADQPDGEAALGTLATFLSTQVERVEALQTQVPPEALPAIEAALDAMTSAASQTEAVSSTCPDCVPPTDEPTFPAPDPSTAPCVACPITPPDLDPSPAPLPEPSRPAPTEPTPPAAPSIDPIPDPDRLPNVPGRVDDQLEDPLRRLIEEFATSL